MNTQLTQTEIQEKVLKPANGMLMMFIFILGVLASLGAVAFGAVTEQILLCLIGGLLLIIFCVLFAGLKSSIQTRRWSSRYLVTTMERLKNPVFSSSIRLHPAEIQ